MKSKFRTRSQSQGHTLVEMMVAVTVLTIFMGMVAKAQQPFTLMVYDLQDRARASSELHLAVDWLSRDIGAAERLTREGSSRLLIHREAAAAIADGVRGADLGIRYSLEDGMLVREDLNRKQEFVVAAHLVAFGVARSGSELKIGIIDGREPEQHKVTLVWRDR